MEKEIIRNGVPYENCTKEQLVDMCIKKDTTISNQKENNSQLHKTHNELKKSIQCGSRKTFNKDFDIKKNTRCFIKTSVKSFDAILTEEYEDHLKIRVTDGEGEFFYFIKKTSIIALKTYY